MKLKHINGSVILEGDYKSIKEMLEKNRGAYLQGAYLQGAYLQGADLQGADLRGAKYGEIEIKNTIISITNLKYDILIFSGYIKIGCQFHDKEKWKAFTNEEIIKMDGKAALEWWNVWKSSLLLMCENNI